MALGSITRAGEITEIVGRLSSGRTSLLMAVLRRATHAGAANSAAELAVALVVLSSRRIAGAGAALAVETVQAGVDWGGPARTATRLARLRSRVSVVRDRAALVAPPSEVDWWCA